MLLPKIAGPDVLQSLKKNPRTKEIAVVACTGLSGKNAERLKKDGACAFLEKEHLGLDKGADGLLAEVRRILRELGRELPAGARAQGN
jgi:CheY-like chemotaxis protein